MLCVLTMISNSDLKRWLGEDRVERIKANVLSRVRSEQKERLFRNPDSKIDFGYSFPGVDAIKLACLDAIRTSYVANKQRPLVADIGAGFGSMTWKMLCAGASVSAFEIQVPTAAELNRRMQSLDETLLEQAPLEEVLQVHAGDALEILAESEFKEKFDYVWISQVIHFMTPSQIEQLNGILQQIVKPDGQVFMVSNNLHQFKVIPGQEVLQRAYDKALSKGQVCPGFLAFNGATLIDRWAGRAVGFRIVSAYNLEEMKINGISQIPQAYGHGYIGPTPLDTCIPEYELAKAEHGERFKINKFYQVMNLFEPETAAMAFRSSGFDVVSFNLDIGTGKKFLSSDRDVGTTVATVILLQKHSATYEVDQEKRGLKRASIGTLSALFEPSIDDKLHIIIDKVLKPKVKASLTDALNDANYSLLLRRACASGQHQLVLELLKQKEVLKVDINQTSSNGKTALDWLITSHDSTYKQRCINLLIQNGALPASAEKASVLMEASNRR